MGEPVRPPDYTGGKALGVSGPVCTGEPKLARPLIVDLEPDARVDLEASMKKGVVVVAYDCQTLRVLSNCRLADGGYEYAGVSRKEQIVQMKGQDDLSVNLPLSAGKLGGEIQSGRSIDLALVLIGRRTTTVGRVERPDLSGTCDGATHFVMNASLGAFSIATGSVGKVAVVAELFKVGASASSESARNASTTDGSLAACRTSDPESDKPPAECRTPIRVELLPILGQASPAEQRASKKAPKKKEEGKIEEDPCRAGYHFADGICTKATEVAYLCDPKDKAECKEQCDKGSAASCNSYGWLLGQGNGLEYYKKACDGGSSDGCVNQAIYTAPGDLAKTDMPGFLEGFKLAQKACSMGNGEGCEVLAEQLKDKTSPHYSMSLALRTHLRGCALGNGESCLSASSMYVFGEGKTPKDPLKGVELLDKSCQSGDAGNCDALAQTLSEGKYDVPKDLPRALRAARKSCDADVENCFRGGRIALEMGKDELGFTLLKRGCDADGETECTELGDLYAAGKGTPKDLAKAKEMWALACKKGKGDDNACKQLGVKMK